MTIQRFSKSVRVWSGRRNREVTVEVDYQRIRTGGFTLLHIARLRDSIGDANLAVLPRRDFR